MRTLFGFTVVGLFCLSAMADIRLTKDDARHFMTVVESLQHLLYSASQTLDTPKDVHHFRELVNSLRKHQSVLKQTSSEDRESFARFLWEADPWTNRNLGIADRSGEGASVFAKMFLTLDENTDQAIARNAELKKILVDAANRIEGASGLESRMERPAERSAKLNALELEAAVNLAALGLSHFPTAIQGLSQQNDYYAKPKAKAFVYFFYFFENAEAMAELKRQAKTSLHAAIALQIVQSTEAKKLMERLALHVRVASGDDMGLVEITDYAKFNVYASALLGAVAVARDELEDSFPPTLESPRVPFIRNPKADGTALSKEDAETTLAFVGDMLEGMEALANSIHWNLPMAELRNQADYQALRNSAASLRALLQYLDANKGNNHLVTQWYQIHFWSARNYLLTGSQENGTSQTERLHKAILEGNQERVLEAIRSITQGSLSLESTPGTVEEAPQRNLDLAQVEKLEILYTESFTVAAGMMALQGIPAAAQHYGYNNRQVSDARRAIESLKKTIQFLDRRPARVKYIEGELTRVKATEAAHASLAVVLLGKTEGVLKSLNELESVIEPLSDYFGGPANESVRAANEAKFKQAMKRLVDLMANRTTTIAGDDEDDCISRIVRGQP